MATEPQHSENMAGAPSSSEHADLSADTALIAGALARIEATIRDERAALGRLRFALGEMAQSIARAKTVADSETATTMLDEFEHRVDAMLEIAGGEPMRSRPAMPEPLIPEPVAEFTEVPTVSGVVSALGPNDPAPEPAVPETAEPAEAPNDKAPTVAMLTAMVEALSASIQPTEPETPAQPDVSEKPDVAAALPVESTHPETTDHEAALLASLELMDARPFPPPDEGMAVIFASPAPPETPPGSSAPPEPAVEPEPEQAIATPQAVPEPAIAPAHAASEPPAIPAATESVSDFDPTDFLFGPEPEPDPAAFLLEPTPAPAQEAVVLPQPEFVTTPSDQTSAEEPQSDEPTSDTAQTEIAQPAPHDPLRAFKAMSENEKLAIFT